MTKSHSIAEARNQLAALVHDTERGHRVVLTRRGKPVAVLISARDYEQLSGESPSFWTALEEFRKRHDLEGLDAEDVFANVRDRAPGRKFKW